MPALRWTFELGRNEATARTVHGQYFVRGDGHKVWRAWFRRSAVLNHLLPGETTEFDSTSFQTIADAVRACTRHAETFQPGGSDRLPLTTPLPGSLY